MPFDGRRTMGSKRKSKKSRTKRTRTKRILRYSTLTARQKATYDRTTNLITDIRGWQGFMDGTIPEAPPRSRTARKYAGRDLLGGTRGKPVRASKADRRVRDLLFPTPSGDVPIRTRNSHDATKLSDYYNDREKLLRGKLSVANFETKWRGVRIADEEVFADAPEILEMADADVLKMETLYASVGLVTMIGRKAKTVLRHSRQHGRPPRKVCPFCFEAITSADVIKSLT